VGTSDHREVVVHLLTSGADAATKNVLAYWSKSHRWFFGTEAFFRISYVVSSGNSGISKNKATSLWHFGPNSAVRKFRHGKSVALSYIRRIMFNHNCRPQVYMRIEQYLGLVI